VVLQTLLWVVNDKRIHCCSGSSQTFTIRGSVSLKGVLYFRKQGDKMNQAWLGKTLASVCVCVRERESECILSCRQCLGEFWRWNG